MGEHFRVKLFISAVALMLSSVSPSTWAGDHVPFNFFTPVMLASIDANPGLKHALLRRCERALTREPQAIVEFAPSPHYNEQGVNERSLKESAALKEDAKHTYDLGLCFALTHDPKFENGIKRVTSAWMNSLERVSSRQGIATVNFMMPYMILGASAVTRGDAQWRRHFGIFLKEKILPLSKVNQAKNNHANWGNLLTTSIAAFLGDRSLLKTQRERWEALMLSQIDASGELPLELCRTNTNQYCSGPDKGIKGLEYTHYTLLPSTLTALILEREGQPVWHTAGGEKLKAAYLQTASWVRNPSTYPYWPQFKERVMGVEKCNYFWILNRIYPDGQMTAWLKTHQPAADAFHLKAVFSVNVPRFENFQQ